MSGPAHGPDAPASRRRRIGCRLGPAALLCVVGASAIDAAQVVDAAAATAGGIASGDRLVASIGGIAGLPAAGGRFMAVGFAAQIANRAPVATPPAPVDVAGGGSRALTLAGSDPDGDGLLFEITRPPAHGTLAGTGASRTYAPSSGFAGTDTFAYRIGDGAAWSAPATVTLVVHAQPPLPMIVGPLTVTAPRGAAFRYAIRASGEPVAYSAAPLPPGLSIDTGTGVIAGTPTALGTTAIVLTAANAAGSAVATLQLTVVDDPAAALLDVAEVTLAGTVSGAAEPTVRIDGIAVPVAGGAWSATLTLPGGATSDDVRIEARDGAGRTTVLDLRASEHAPPPAPGGPG